MSTTIQTISADQLFQMPHHGFRYELVKGVLRKMTPAGFHHGQLVVNLTVSLATYVKANSLGVVVGAKTGFKIESNPDTVLDPDVAFVRQERVLQMGRTEKFWPGAPDLAVEVLSPSDTVYEVDEKVAAWLAVATPLIRVLNPKQRTIHVHRPGASVRVVLESDLLDGQEVIPGFHTSVSEIFADS